MSNVSQAAREPAPILMPTLLSFVAGYVDSYTYLALFGLFAAQVTGSFVVAGAELVKHDYGIVSKALAILAFIAAGASTAALIGAVHRREWPALSLMLALETVLLAIFAAMMLFGPPIESVTDWYGVTAGLFAAMAMGTQSVLVRLLMHGVPQTNVMTGNMTQLAIELTELVKAWLRKSRDPNRQNSEKFTTAGKRLWIVLSVAVAFLAGTAAGAIAYARIGVGGLLFATAIVAMLASRALFVDWQTVTGRSPS
jgi:uncharacterized membrane protein YoaK (UPF0700 family)